MRTAIWATPTLLELRYSRWLLCCRSVALLAVMGKEGSQNTDPAADRSQEFFVGPRPKELKASTSIMIGILIQPPNLHCPNSLNIPWGETILTDFWNPCLQACKLLSDDYEQVRSAAVQLIWVVSQLYPERSVWVWASFSSSLSHFSLFLPCKKPTSRKGMLVEFLEGSMN